MSIQPILDTSPVVRTRSNRAVTLDDAAEWLNSVGDKLQAKLTSRHSKSLQQHPKQLIDTIEIYLKHVTESYNSLMSPNSASIIQTNDIQRTQLSRRVSDNDSIQQQTNNNNTILSQLTLNLPSTRRNSTDELTPNNSNTNELLHSIKGGLSDLVSSFKSLNSSRNNNHNTNNYNNNNNHSRRNSNDYSNFNLPRKISIVTINENSTELTIDTSNSALKDYYMNETKECNSGNNNSIDVNSGNNMLSPLSANSIYVRTSQTSPNFTFRTNNNNNILPASIHNELEQLVHILYGDVEYKITDPILQNECCLLLVDEHDILKNLILHIDILEFESRKNLCKIIEFLMQQYTDKTVQYIVFKPEILYKLANVYDINNNTYYNSLVNNILSTRSDSSIAYNSINNTNTVTTPVLTSTSITTPTLTAIQEHNLNLNNNNNNNVNSTITPGSKLDTQLVLCCDLILRSLLSHHAVTAKFLNTEPSLVWPFFNYSQVSIFELSSHAFDTLKYILTQHTDISNFYITHHYDIFIEHINKLLELNDNYYIQHNTWKLLYTLLQQSNELCNMYINDVNNLRIAMINLKASNKLQQKQVYYVLHMFICNNNKSAQIERIISNNRDNFVRFLEQFENDTDDQHLIHSKVQMLEALNSIDNTN